MDQIFGMPRYQKQTKRNKNWGYHNEGNPQMGPPEFKLFTLLS